MSIQEDARKVREVIETNGWCQRVNKNFKGEVCLLGACEEARISILGSSLLSALFDELLNLGFSQISAYNDYPGRTKQEVINLLVKIETNE